MQRKVLKTSNLAYRMLLAQGQIYAKNMAFYMRIGCVRFARYCGKMYSRHLFPHGGLSTHRQPAILLPTFDYLVVTEHKTSLKWLESHIVSPTFIMLSELSLKETLSGPSPAVCLRELSALEKVLLQTNM